MYQDEPVIPHRLPTAAIMLLWASIVLLMLAAVGALLVLIASALGVGPTSIDLSLPETPVERAIWVQSALTVVAMFLLWLLGLLVAVAYAQGRHRAAAANAQVLLRVTMLLILIRFAVGASIPAFLSGTFWASLVALGTGAPMVIAEIALLICADVYCSAVHRNAAT